MVRLFTDYRNGFFAISFFMEYSSIQELIRKIKNTTECKVVDGWQENKWYVLVLLNTSNKSVRLKVLFPN